MVSIAVLQPGEVAYVDQRLPLNRLDQQVEEGSTYLVAWDDQRPIGHAHIAWVGTVDSWMVAAVERAIATRRFGGDMF